MRRKICLKSLIIVFFFCLPIVSPMSAYAETARSGILGCGGNHFSRVISNEVGTTNYVFRNYNTKETISINRIVIVDGNGTFLFDGLPGVTFKATLGPMQSTKFNSSDVLTNFLQAADQPTQTYVIWRTASGAPAEGLFGAFVSITRDTTTQAENSRIVSDCKDLF